MIDMGMGKDEGIDLFPLAEFAAVALKGLFAFSLVETAVEHDGSAVDFNKMQGAGNGPGGPVKGDFHDFPLRLGFAGYSIQGAECCVKIESLNLLREFVEVCPERET